MNEAEHLYVSPDADVVERSVAAAATAVYASGGDAGAGAGSGSSPVPLSRTNWWESLGPEQAAVRARLAAQEAEAQAAMQRQAERAARAAAAKEEARRLRSQPRYAHVMSAIAAQLASKGGSTGRSTPGSPTAASARSTGASAALSRFARQARRLSNRDPSEEGSTAHAAAAAASSSPATAAPSSSHTSSLQRGHLELSSPHTSLRPSFSDAQLAPFKHGTVAPLNQLRRAGLLSPRADTDSPPMRRERDVHELARAILGPPPPSLKELEPGMPLSLAARPAQVLTMQDAIDIAAEEMKKSQSEGALGASESSGVVAQEEKESLPASSHPRSPDAASRSQPQPAQPYSASEFPPYSRSGQSLPPLHLRTESTPTPSSSSSSVAAAAAAAEASSTAAIQQGMVDALERRADRGTRVIYSRMRLDEDGATSVANADTAAASNTQSGIFSRTRGQGLSQSASTPMLRPSTAPVPHSPAVVALHSRSSPSDVPAVPGSALLSQPVPAPVLSPASAPPLQLRDLPAEVPSTVLWEFRDLGCSSHHVRRSVFDNPAAVAAKKGYEAALAAGEARAISLEEAKERRVAASHLGNLEKLRQQTPSSTSRTIGVGASGSSVGLNQTDRSTLAAATSSHGSLHATALSTQALQALLSPTLSASLDLSTRQGRETLAELRYIQGCQLELLSLQPSAFKARVLRDAFIREAGDRIRTSGAEHTRAIVREQARLGRIQLRFIRQQYAALERGHRAQLAEHDAWVRLESAARAANRARERNAKRQAAEALRVKHVALVGGNEPLAAEAHAELVRAQRLALQARKTRFELYRHAHQDSVDLSAGIDAATTQSELPLNRTQRRAMEAASALKSARSASLGGAGVGVGGANAGHFHPLRPRSPLHDPLPSRNEFEKSRAPPNVPRGHHSYVHLSSFRPDDDAHSQMQHGRGLFRRPKALRERDESMGAGGSADAATGGMSREEFVQRKARSAARIQAARAARDSVAVASMGSSGDPDAPSPFVPSRPDLSGEELSRERVAWARAEETKKARVRRAQQRQHQTAETTQRARGDGDRSVSPQRERSHQEKDTEDEDEDVSDPDTDEADMSSIDPNALLAQAHLALLGPSLPAAEEEAALAELEAEIAAGLQSYNNRGADREVAAGGAAPSNSSSSSSNTAALVQRALERNAAREETAPHVVTRTLPLTVYEAPVLSEREQRRLQREQRALEESRAEQQSSSLEGILSTLLPPGSPSTGRSASPTASSTASPSPRGDGGTPASSPTRRFGGGSLLSPSHRRPGMSRSRSRGRWDSSTLADQSPMSPSSSSSVRSAGSRAGLLSPASSPSSSSSVSRDDTSSSPRKLHRSLSREQHQAGVDASSQQWHAAPSPSGAAAAARAREEAESHSKEEGRRSSVSLSKRATLHITLPDPSEPLMSTSASDAALLPSSTAAAADGDADTLSHSASAPVLAPSPDSGTHRAASAAPAPAPGPAPAPDPIPIFREPHRDETNFQLQSTEEAIEEARSLDRAGSLAHTDRFKPSYEATSPVVLGVNDGTAPPVPYAPELTKRVTIVSLSASPSSAETPRPRPGPLRASTLYMARTHMRRVEGSPATWGGNQGAQAAAAGRGAVPALAKPWLSGLNVEPEPESEMESGEHDHLSSPEPLGAMTSRTPAAKSSVPRGVPAPDSPVAKAAPSHRATVSPTRRVHHRTPSATSSPSFVAASTLLCGPSGEGQAPVRALKQRWAHVESKLAKDPTYRPLGVNVTVEAEGESMEDMRVTPVESDPTQASTARLLASLRIECEGHTPDRGDGFVLSFTHASDKNDSGQGLSNNAFSMRSPEQSPVLQRPTTAAQRASAPYYPEDASASLDMQIALTPSQWELQATGNPKHARSLSQSHSAAQLKQASATTSAITARRAMTARKGSATSRAGAAEGTARTSRTHRKAPLPQIAPSASLPPPKHTRSSPSLDLADPLHSVEVRARRAAHAGQQSVVYSHMVQGDASSRDSARTLLLHSTSPTRNPPDPSLQQWPSSRPGTAPGLDSSPDLELTPRAAARRRLYYSAQSARVSPLSDYALRQWMTSHRKIFKAPLKPQESSGRHGALIQHCAGKDSPFRVQQATGAGSNPGAATVSNLLDAPVDMRDVLQRMLERTNGVVGGGGGGGGKGPTPAITPAQLRALEVTLLNHFGGGAVSVSRKVGEKDGSAIRGSSAPLTSSRGSGDAVSSDGGPSHIGTLSVGHFVQRFLSSSLAEWDSWWSGQKELARSVSAASTGTGGGQKRSEGGLPNQAAILPLPLWVPAYHRLMLLERLMAPTSPRDSAVDRASGGSQQDGSTPIRAGSSPPTLVELWAQTQASVAHRLAEYHDATQQTTHAAAALGKEEEARFARRLHRIFSAKLQEALTLQLDSEREARLDEREAKEEAAVAVQEAEAAERKARATSAARRILDQRMMEKTATPRSAAILAEAPPPVRPNSAKSIAASIHMLPSSASSSPSKHAAARRLEPHDLSSSGVQLEMNAAVFAPLRKATEAAASIHRTYHAMEAALDAATKPVHIVVTPAAGESHSGDAVHAAATATAAAASTAARRGGCVEEPSADEDEDKPEEYMLSAPETPTFGGKRTQSQSQSQSPAPARAPEHPSETPQLHASITAAAPAFARATPAPVSVPILSPSPASVTSLAGVASPCSVASSPFSDADSEAAWDGLAGSRTPTPLADSSPLHPSAASDAAGLAAPPVVRQSTRRATVSKELPLMAGAPLEEEDPAARALAELGARRIKSLVPKRRGASLAMDAEAAASIVVKEQQAAVLAQQMAANKRGSRTTLSPIVPLRRARSISAAPAEGQTQPL